MVTTQELQRRSSSFAEQQRAEFGDLFGTRRRVLSGCGGGFRGSVGDAMATALAEKQGSPRFLAQRARQIARHTVGQVVIEVHVNGAHHLARPGSHPQLESGN